LGLRWVDVFARSLRIQQGQTPDDKTKNNASTVASGEQKNDKCNKMFSTDLIHDDAEGKTCSLTRQNRINQLDR